MSSPKKQKFSRIKTKKAEKKNRQKSSLAIPFMVFAVICLMAAYFIIKDGTIFTFGQKPVVAKKTPKKVKPKIKKPKKVVVKEVKPVVKALAPIQETFKMTGEITHQTFSEVLKNKCIECHGTPGNKIEGDFDLVKLLASSGVNNRHWQAVYEQVEKGEMPPEDEEPLTADEKLVLLSELRKISSGSEIARKTRALTPDEIKNSLVDLFGIDEDIYNPFTPLYANYGQDKFFTMQKSVITPYYIDDLYETLHDALESYVALKPQTEPLNVATTFPGRIHLQEKVGSSSDLRWGRKESDFVQVNFKNLEVVKKKKILKRDITGPKSEGEALLAKLSLPPGTYKLSFDAQALNLDKKINEKKYGASVVGTFKRLTEKHEYSLPVSFYLVPPGQADPHARVKTISTIDIDSSEMSRYTVKFTINRRNGLGYHFPVGLVPGDSGLASMIAHHRVKGRPVERKDIEEMYKRFLRVPNYEFPMVRFKNVKLDGPYDVQVSDYSVSPKERMDDITIRKKFRVLHNDNLIQMNMPYDYIFSKFKQRQIGPEESYRNALVSFFLSPDFLTLEYDTKDARKHARMLSYVFHKSPPSKVLSENFSKAIKGRSTTEFTEWLVAHENFSRYISSFSEQWLHLSNINNAQPDRRTYKDFYQKDLLSSYKKEIKGFLLYLFQENRPVHELVSANYSILNNDLIQFYDGGARKEQDSFAKYDFRSKSRGGVLSSGAFLTATGNGVEPLPIKRAEWILENILDSKLPTPPADISLEQFQQDLSGPLHERLKSHSSDPKCYSCHKKIDPLAIFMNGFNTIGGENYKDSTTPVKLNDQVIRNFGDLKSYLGTQEDSIARSFVKSLLKFSLGRELYIQDGALIDQIIAENKEAHYPTRNLLNSIVKHYFFKK